MGHVNLQVKLKEKQLEEDTKELFASIIPNGVTYFFGRKAGI